MISYIGYISVCYDHIPGLIGNVESVRYSSGLNATGGPSAKNDGSIVGLKYGIFYFFALGRSVTVHAFYGP